MVRFQFTHLYFKKLNFSDLDKNVYIHIREKPSFNITEDDYSLILETYNPKSKQRHHAIEHHLTQNKHNKPHLQFKFHAEKIGSLWINLSFKNEEEYKRGIEGFIYQSKYIFEELEIENKNITQEMLILDEVIKLEPQSKFLKQKVKESILLGLIEFKEILSKDKQELIKKHKLLNNFLGNNNISLLLEKSK